MLHKWKALLVSLVLALAIALPVVPSVAAQKEFTIALVPGMSAHPFYWGMYAGAKKAAEQLGVKLIYQGAVEWSYEKQSRIVRSLIARGDIDFLLFCPCDVDANVPDVEEAVRRGIPVIQIDSTVNSDLPLTFIGFPNFKGGEILGEVLAKAIGYKGEVAAVLSDAGAQTDTIRYQGFRKVIDKYPDIKFASLQYAHEDQAKATMQTQSILMAHPNLVGIYGNDTFTSHGVAIGIRNAGKTGKVKHVAFDAQLLQIQDMKQGLLEALLAQKPYAEGYLGVQFAYDYLMGFMTEFPREIETGYLVITPENVGDPETAMWIYPTEIPK